MWEFTKGWGSWFMVWGTLARLTCLLIVFVSTSDSSNMFLQLLHKSSCNLDVRPSIRHHDIPIRQVALSFWESLPDLSMVCVWQGFWLEVGTGSEEHYLSWNTEMHLRLLKVLCRHPLEFHLCKEFVKWVNFRTILIIGVSCLMRGPWKGSWFQCSSYCIFPEIDNLTSYVHPSCNNVFGICPPGSTCCFLDSTRVSI